MHKILPKKKKEWTALIAGWQAQVDRARAAGQSADVKSPVSGSASSVKRGFLDGHRRPGTYPHFTRHSASTQALGSGTASTKIYVHEVSVPSVKDSVIAKDVKQAQADRTQKSYKCLKVSLVFKPFCEYLSNTTKKRISTPNKLNSVLHFASVLTLVVAQIVLLGTYFIALAPRARVTRTFFQEIHKSVYQEDTAKREALIEQWQTKVATLSGMYAAGLASYALLMAAFLGTTVAFFFTRRPQDPWWGWLNWAQAIWDAREYVTGSQRVPMGTGSLGAIGSADTSGSFGPFTRP